MVAKVHIIGEQTGNTRRGGTFQNALEVLHASIAARFIADSLSVLASFCPVPQLEAHSDDSVCALSRVLQVEHNRLKSGLIYRWFLGSSSAHWSGSAAVPFPAESPLPSSTVNSW